MRRWMPQYLILLGLLLLALLSWPFWQPIMFWAIIFSPVIKFVWNFGPPTAAMLIVVGVLWLVMRRRQAKTA